MPQGLAAGGAQPAGEAAEAGIAVEAESRGLDGRRIGRVAPGTEASGAFEKVNGDFGIGVAEGGSAGLD